MSFQPFLSACTRRAARLLLPTLLLSAVSVLGGCGSAALRNGVSDPLASALPAISGTAFGGQQPVVGATVQLYAAGTASYGSAARPLVNCTGAADGNGVHTAPCTGVTTQTNGTFSITSDYTCPPGAYVYLVATGGNSGYTNNSALAVMAGLGPCSGIGASTFVNLNEVTTAATVIALQQFMSATYGTVFAENIGAPTSNTVGLANAFAAIPQMVNLATGTALATSSSTAAINGSSVVLNWTSESAKLNTLGNILSYCVNSGDSAGPPATISSACTNLFAAVKPASQANASADTIQAMMDLTVNPNNTAVPFTYVNSFPAFAPVLSTAPNDWTMSLGYYSSSATRYPPTTGSSQFFLSAAYTIQVDSLGNAWVLNESAPSVSAIAPGGVPYAQVLNSSLNSPRGMALDASNNIFVGNYGATSTGAITEFSGGAITNFTSSAYTQIYSMAVDGHGNVFAAARNNGTNAQLLELPAGSPDGTAVTSLMKTGSNSTSLAVDASNNVWVAATSGASGTQVTEAVATCTGTVTVTCTYPSTGTGYTGGTGTSQLIAAWGVAIDSNGAPWVSDGPNGASTTLGNQVTRLTPGTPSTSIGTGEGVSGVSGPQGVAIDGGNNIWVASNGATANTGTVVSEFNNSGAALSGTNGFQINFSNGATGVQETSTGPRAVAIDASGNVWIGNTTGYNSATSSVLALNEMIGAAVPAVTPLALALKNNALGQRP